MTPIKTSFTLPEKTKDQLESLARTLGMTLTQAIVVAVDRMEREELKGGPGRATQRTANRTRKERNVSRNQRLKTGDFADYTYVVKEFPYPNPPPKGEEVLYLQCSPRSRELDCISDREELWLMLKEGTTWEEAQEIKRYLQEHAPVIQMAHFQF